MMTNLGDISNKYHITNILVDKSVLSIKKEEWKEKTRQAKEKAWIQKTSENKTNKEPGMKKATSLIRRLAEEAEDWWRSLPWGSQQKDVSACAQWAAMALTVKVKGNEMRASSLLVIRKRVQT